MNDQVRTKIQNVVYEITEDMFRVEGIEDEISKNIYKLLRTLYEADLSPDDIEHIYRDHVKNQRKEAIKTLKEVLAEFDEDNEDEFYDKHHKVVSGVNGVINIETWVRNTEQHFYKLMEEIRRKYEANIG